MDVINKIDEINCQMPTRDGVSLIEIARITTRQILDFNASSTKNKVKAIVFEADRGQLIFNKNEPDSQVNIKEIRGDQKLQITDDTLNDFPGA